MLTLDYDNDGFAKQAKDLIDVREPFTIRVSGLKAKLLKPFFPTNNVVLDPATIGLILVIASLASLAGVALYAISKGCNVKGRTNPDGSISFEVKCKDL